MTSQMCIDAIKAAGTGLSDDDVEAIVTRVFKRQAELKKASALASDAEAFARAAKEIADEDKLAALIEKRSRALNVMAKHRRFGFYETHAGEEATALRALNVGVEGPGFGMGKSVDAQHKALTGELVGGMVGELRRGDLIPLIKRRDETFERDIARELWRISDDAQPSTGNTHAAQVAKIVNKYQEGARLMQNDAGAWIGKASGYVTRQSHDQTKIAGAGKEADYIRWRDAILPKLDERTFADVDDREAFMRATWQNLASGDHHKANGASDWLGGFKGPGNLAKKASQERSLHFKSADDWFEYNKLFGRGSLFESVVSGLDHAARNTALMRTWGTNPEAAFLVDQTQLVQRAKTRGDLDTVKELKGWVTSAQFDQISGAANIPDSPRLAQISSATRAVISMASLGGVVLSSLPDIAVRASVLRHNGIGLLDAYGGAIRSIFEGRTKGEKREIADALAAGTDGIIGSVLSRFDATDNMSGRMSKLMNKFFELNLLTWWTDAHKTGIGLALARNVAFHSESVFANLPERMQTTLGRYGIDARNWDTIRQATISNADGGRYLTPDAIRHLDDDVMRAHLGKANASEAELKRARTDLETQLRTYYTDQIREGMTEAGARERALVQLTTKPGTAVGEAVRFLTQFKTYPLTYVTRHLNRELNRGGSVDTGGLAHLIIATTALGYVSLTAKELIKGREPRKPEDFLDYAKLLGAAFQQGGGLGVYGDFLFGSANRQGQGIAETLGGPALGKLSEIKSIVEALTKGDDMGKNLDTAGDKAVRFAISNVPFQNLFYTRMALDWLVLYQVQEWLNPGSLRRMEKRIEKEQNQKFFVRPSSAIPYGGGDRVFEGVR